MYRLRFVFAVILIAGASVHVARSQDATPDTQRDTNAIALLQSAMRSRIAIGYGRDGHAVLARHCSRSSEGCERRLAEFAEYIMDASHAYGVDPWLVAAMAFKESGLNPFAQGAVGELGILQIHPKRRDARQVRFIRDEWYRMRCHRQAGACQREVVRHATHVLARSLELCGGDIKEALGAYNTGRCGGNRRYVKRVLLERDELRRVVGLDAEVASAADQANRS